ncbi:hypothetical protein [Thermoflavimicrobium daqui]|nr:hypothetical protein [Thermoflavimicrobium daqui]
MIAQADFGHTYPMFPFPIGGRASIKAEKEQVWMQISD